MHKLFNLHFKLFYVKKYIEKAYMCKTFVRGKNIWHACNVLSNIFFQKTLSGQHDATEKIKALAGPRVGPNNMGQAQQHLAFSFLFLFLFSFLVSIYFFNKLMLLDICFFFQIVFIYI